MKYLKSLLIRDSFFINVIFQDDNISKDTFLAKGIPFLEYVVFGEYKEHYLHYWTNPIEPFELFTSLKSVPHSFL